MADDNHENGTSNGDVPEIELIIKVSVPRAVEDRRASETDGSEHREEGRETKEKEAVCPVRAMGVEQPTGSRSLP